MSQQGDKAFKGNEFDSVMTGQIPGSADGEAAGEEPADKPVKEKAASGKSKAAKLKKPLIVFGVIAAALVAAGAYKRMGDKPVEVSQDVMEVMALAGGEMPRDAQPEPAAASADLMVDAASFPDAAIEQDAPALATEAASIPAAPVAAPVAAPEPAAAPAAPAKPVPAAASNQGLVATVANPESEAELARVKRELQQQRNRAAQAEARARAAAANAQSFTVTSVLSDGVVVRDAAGKEHVIAVGGRIGK